MKHLLTFMLLAGSAALCPADPIVLEPSVATEIHARIDETGGIRAVGTMERGELSCRLAVWNDDSLRIESLYLRHPMLSVGFLERGDLFRLLNSPAGAWGRVSAGLLAGVKAGKGETFPDTYGIILSPAPERIAVFSFFEPDVSCCGTYLLVGGFDHSLELLATYARPASQRPPEEWLLETRIVQSPTLLHLLWRLSADFGLIRFTGGTVISCARFMVPQIAGSASVELAVPRLSASVCFSGGTRDYLTVEGRAASVPLEVSWRLATGSSLTGTFFIEHRVEVETLPLTHVRYRATEESVEAGLGIKTGPIGVEGRGEARLRSDRSARRELAVGGELSLGVYFNKASVAIDGEVRREDDGSLRWNVSVPVKLETGLLRCSGEAALLHDEVYQVSLSAEITHGEKKDLQWYIGAQTDLPVLGWPGASTDSSTTGNRKPAVEFGYRVGWRVKR